MTASAETSASCIDNAAYVLCTLTAAAEQHEGSQILWNMTAIFGSQHITNARNGTISANQRQLCFSPQHVRFVRAELTMIAG
jgi:hypothetical protein